MPKPEQVLWYWLRGRRLNGWKFRRQHSIGNYIVDFYCPEIRLVIELDGDSHFNSQAKGDDQNRDMFLNSKNIRVIRFLNTDISENIEAVIYQILNTSPNPS